MVSAADQILELTRGVSEVLSESDFARKIKKSVETGKGLCIKAGFDPTAPDLHLGHTVLLEKMRQFQDFGHSVVFLIGDFTGLVGDPTGKSKTRPQLTREQIQDNAETYKAQVFKILDPQKTAIKFNSEWIDKLTPYDFVKLTGHTSVAQMLERDDFSKRYKEGVSISLHEFLYPLLQAYDSVCLKSDVELGGTDQKFNLLLGRELMRDFNIEPQVCIMMPLLEGLDGVQKMSKSLDNYVGVTDEPQNMFGKLMSLPDSIMRRYFDLLSQLKVTDIQLVFEDLKLGKRHPREVKVLLAKEIVAQYHSVDAANHASSEFDRIFSKKEMPSEMLEGEAVLDEKGEVWIPRILHQYGLIKTTSEGKRLIDQRAIKINDVAIVEERIRPRVGENIVIQCGKRRFLRVTIL